MKTEPKHTPGPWTYKRTHSMSPNTWYVLIDPNGRGPIFEIGGRDITGQIGEAKYLITDPAEIEANAAFIVEACNNYERVKAERDELAAALKRTLDALFNETHGQKDTPWVATTKLEARAALAKLEDK